MPVPFQHFWRTVILAVTTLWVALIALYAFYVFVYPTVPNYGPELGPTASFEIACVFYSLYYLGFFLFIVVPIACIFRFFSSRDHITPPEA